MTSVAVLGTGHMGAPVARRLLAAGHRVTVWNRTPSRTAEIPGANVADSPADAVLDAKVVIVMVTDAAAVGDVLFGPSGAASALRLGALILQMSTIAPDEVLDVARRLPEGVALLDVPVAGSFGAAESGRLTLLVGGDDAAVHVAEPVLASLGTVRRCGAVGTGSALKLVLNTALVTAVAALADTLAVADAVGVDRATAIDALAGSALGGAVTRTSGTGAAFSLALAGKDIDLALRETNGTPVPLARAAAGVLRKRPDQTADISALVDEQQDGEGERMKVTLDNPDGVAAPFAERFAHVARLDVGDGALLMLAGQVGVDDDGVVVAPGDAGAQAERIFEIIGGILAAHGATFDDVLHIRTFMTSLDDLPAYGAVRRRIFTHTPPPASTTVEVSRLFLPDAVLEIEITAATTP